MVTWIPHDGMAEARRDQQAARTDPDSQDYLRAAAPAADPGRIGKEAN